MREPDPAEYMEMEVRRANGLAAMAEYEAGYGAFTPEEPAEARAFNDDLLGRLAATRRS